jgi:hypothetical protein
LQRKAGERVRTLYLHVGPAKTGTSAVQHILRNHDNSTIIYPKVGMWADGSHHNLVLNYFGDYARPEMVRENAESLFARIGEEARASDRDLLISSEILAGRRNLGEFVQALQKQLGGDPFRVEAVMVAREHFERAASLYNQRVKDAVSAEPRNPDAFLVEHAPRLCYANILRNLRRTGFEITVLNYHPAEHCVARVLRHLGFRRKRIPETPARNVSLSSKGLIATLAANRLGAPQERERFVSALCRMPRFFAPSRFIFGPEAAAKAERTFAADREFLKKQFAVELPPPDLNAAARAFAIGEQDFADICAATQGLGDYGKAIRETVREYVKLERGAHPELACLRRSETSASRRQVEG